MANNDDKKDDKDSKDEEKGDDSLGKFRFAGLSSGLSALNEPGKAGIDEYVKVNNSLSGLNDKFVDITSGLNDLNDRFVTASQAVQNGLTVPNFQMPEIPTFTVRPPSLVYPDDTGSDIKLGADEVQETLESLKEKTETNAKQIAIYVAQIKNYESDIKQLGKTIRSLSEEYKAQSAVSRKDLINVKKGIRALKKEKISLIGMLGIFVAVFTFITVDIKILADADGFLAIAGLSMLMFSGLTLFVCLIHVLATKWLEGEYAEPPKKFMRWVIGLAIGGVVLTALGDFLPLLFSYFDSKQQPPTLETPATTEHDSFDSIDTVIRDFIPDDVQPSLLLPESE